MKWRATTVGKGKLVILLFQNSHHLQTIANCN